MKTTTRYNLIEEGIIHTSDLTHQDALEMEERHNDTSPDVQFWIEPIEYRK